MRKQRSAFWESSTSCVSALEQAQLLQKQVQMMLSTFEVLNKKRRSVGDHLHLPAGFPNEVSSDLQLLYRNLTHSVMAQSHRHAMDCGILHDQGSTHGTESFDRVSTHLRVHHREMTGMPEKRLPGQQYLSLQLEMLRSLNINWPPIADTFPSTEEYLWVWLSIAAPLTESSLMGGIVRG